MTISQAVHNWVELFQGNNPGFLILVRALVVILFHLADQDGNTVNVVGGSSSEEIAMGDEECARFLTSLINRPSVSTGGVVGALPIPAFLVTAAINYMVGKLLDLIVTEIPELADRKAALMAFINALVEDLRKKVGV